MANFLINNLFRIAVITLNYVSPSIVVDILLHPFDFATVLLQIGYHPEGIKFEGATFMSVIVQYALFTFYIPYLLTSMQGLQFMGVPHPSIFYYVNYIYKKEGLIGCYRGFVPKICEKLTMMKVNQKIKQTLHRETEAGSNENVTESDKFLQTLTNSVCAHFFAVVTSHPFHVIMVCSFAEFTCRKNSSVLEITSGIYADDGYLGFFAGLTARMLGELLSLIFSLTYTNIVNKQMAPVPPPEDQDEEEPQNERAATVVNYVTDLTRFSAFKPKKPIEEEMMAVYHGIEEIEVEDNTSNFPYKYYFLILNFLRHITHSSGNDAEISDNHRSIPISAYIPLTSKVFYYVLIRDYISKKISSPFFLVSHCAIVLGTGWEKFPLLCYLRPMHCFVQHRCKRKRNRRCKKIRFNLF